MGDNKLLPASGAGSVITVATDEIGGVDYQRVKAVWGVDGTATDVTATTPLPVGGSGTAALGKAEDAQHASGDVGVMALGVRADTLAPTAADADYHPFLLDALGAQYVVSEERLIALSATPTVTNGAYSAGDVVGGLLTFANAARISGGAIVIEAMTIMCKTPALVNQLELWLFDRTFTNVADNGAVSYSDADMANCIGVIPCGPWAENALNAISTRAAIGLAAILNGTSLFGQLVTRNGPTLTSTSDIIVKLSVRQG